MADRGMNKIILVTRKTRLTELIYKYNTVEQARFYIEHMGVDFSDYLREDMVYRQAVAQVKTTAEKYARIQEIDRDFVSNMIFGEKDIVIAVGQDGLVVNVMKYLDTQPLIGVNPDVSRWDGVLLPFEPGQMTKLLPRVIAGNYDSRQVTMAEAFSKDGQSMLAVNDLFIGCRTHTSARYDITWNKTTENHSSSGIIVSTGLGATGWYKSVMAQTQRIAQLSGGGRISYNPPGWSDDKLTFIVREPYPSCATQADLVFGQIEKTDRFHVTSKMPANGVVFSDGIESDVIEFNAGSEIDVRIASRKGHVVA